MADDPTLVPGVLERIASLRAADIAIGIPSYNNADTIGTVVEAARAALRDPLADFRGVIIHADAGSTDETVEKGLLTRIHGLSAGAPGASRADETGRS